MITSNNEKTAVPPICASAPEALASLTGLTPHATAFVIQFPSTHEFGTDLVAALEGLLFDTLPPEPCDTRTIQLDDLRAIVVLEPECGLPLDPFTTNVFSMHLRSVLQKSASDDAIVVPIARVADFTEKTQRLGKLESMLETLLSKTIGVQFQAIVSLTTGTPFGYESLIRLPQQGDVKRAGLMFGAADNARLVSWFDLACQERCFANAAKANLREHLFINMDADGLSHLATAGVSLAEKAKEANIPPHRVVLEITERQAVEDFPRLIEYISEMRRQGFKIAVDDAASGYSSLSAICSLQPEFIKIERPLTRELTHNGVQRALLDLMVQYAKRIGSAVVVEGIETKDQLAIAIEAGADYGQGYLLSRPKDEFHGIRREIRELIVELSGKQSNQRPSTATIIGSLARQSATIASGTEIGQVTGLLRKHPGSQAIVVVDSGGQMIGLLRTSAVAEFARAAPTTVDWNHLIEYGIPGIKPSATIPEAATWAAARPTPHNAEDLILVQDGVYRGAVSLAELLEYFAKQSQPQAPWLERRAA
jgi:EAL domain-containing protein (putative c-di-GMP-specific phosphodiesterase class I)